jgi:hypothetical protein
MKKCLKPSVKKLGNSNRPAIELKKLTFVTPLPRICTDLQELLNCNRKHRTKLFHTLPLKLGQFQISDRVSFRFVLGDSFMKD